MKKFEFLRRWAKKATAGGSVEAFERDTETLMRTTIRMTVSAITNGMLEAAKDLSGNERKMIDGIARRIPESVENALKQLYE